MTSDITQRRRPYHVRPITNRSKLRGIAHRLIPIVVIGAFISPRVLKDRSFWLDGSNLL